MARSVVTAVLACCTSLHGVVAQDTVTLIQRVNQAPAPPITWNAPDAIPFGLPLSALQLNATSAAAGTFTYQPANGVMLPAGTNTLSVVLSPADTNYQAASASVPLVVVPPGSSSFTVAALGANTHESPLRLEPGVSATVQLAVGPVGDFHQPVALSCSIPPAGRTCLFSPAVIRPVTAPVPVSLTFAPEHGPAANRSSATLPFANEFLPGVAPSAFLGLLFFWRRRAMRTGHLVKMGCLLMFPLLAMVSGCGSGIQLPVVKIEVQGRSLVEVHTLPLYVVEDESLGLRPPSLADRGKR